MTAVFTGDGDDGSIVVRDEIGAVVAAKISAQAMVALGCKLDRVAIQLETLRAAASVGGAVVMDELGDVARMRRSMQRRSAWRVSLMVLSCLEACTINITAAPFGQEKNAMVNCTHYP